MVKCSSIPNTVYILFTKSLAKVRVELTLIGSKSLSKLSWLCNIKMQIIIKESEGEINWNNKDNLYGYYFIKGKQTDADDLVVIMKLY